ncbi:Ribosomal RNA-processing protein 9 [Bienertia sinuspersici]
MNYVPELPITYNNEMASYKNGSVARRSNRDKLSKNCYGNRISTYSVSCSSSCGEDDGCLDDWEDVANALIVENKIIKGAVEHGALMMFTVLEACLAFQSSKCSSTTTVAAAAFCLSALLRGF